MPRPGGEADKFGNRYESLWAVDAVLDLIGSQYVALTFEPLGDEAAGVEFFATNQSGTHEYHSIKRQQSDGNWTINRLTQREGPAARSILGDLIQKTKQGTKGVFSSGTSATELEELVERALASDSIEEFQQRISGSGRLSGRLRTHIVPICGDEEAAYTALRQLRVRTKNEPELTKDVERRVRSVFRTNTGVPIDPTAVRLQIADFVTQRLGATLTADSFLAYLHDHGIQSSRLAGDSTAGQGIQKLNRLYLDEVNTLLINRTGIDRQETEAACIELLDRGKSVMLEGTAGGGKSSVLAQVITQLASRDVPSLVIRLDRLTEADHSAQAIGTRRGLPDSPTITLGEFAGDRPSVLCIDQLDALSFVSARQQSAWGAFNELLDGARQYPNMRILFACRSFDLEQDAQLRALVTDESLVERIRIGELDSNVIHSAITASGIVAAPLSQGQLRVLSTPLHLYLFIEASRSGEVDFTGKGDLFDAFWDHKAKRVQSRLVSQATAWTRATAALCDGMSERESLVAPVYVMDDHREEMEAMASESVLYIEDSFVRFFHEAFFDYAFARTFLRTNSDLVQWLISDEQHLFRRSQVRQVLAFLRDREPDRARYLQTLKGLLEHARVRFHIKKLVLDWLGALPDPTQDEWLIVEGLASQLGGHTWSVVHNSVPWFDVLQDMGRWKSWLVADEQQIDRTVRLFLAPEVQNTRSAAVASLLGPFRGQSDEWRNRLRWLVLAENDYTSPEMEDLVIALIADGTLDYATLGFAMNDDWWSAWYTSSTKWPAFTSRVLGAWFDRQLARAADLGRDDPFNGSPDLVNYSESSEHVIQECGARAPREFVRELFPRFASFDKRVPQEWIAAPNMLGEPDSQLREALAEAMVSLARDNPSELDSTLDMGILSESKWMSALVLRAWSANPDLYSERIVRFLLDCPDQRLNIGYAYGLGNTDMFVAVSRTAVNAASSTCSGESFAELEDAILRFTTPQEREHRQVGRTRLALLRALAQTRIRDETHRQIQELERRFPDAPEYGAPEPPTERMAHRVGPPIPAEAQPRMSDDQWLSAMAQYADEWPTVRRGQFVGGALELSRGLTDLVRKEPGRFAALANRMDATHPVIYFEAIISGLTDNEGGSRRPGTLDQVCSVLRRIRTLRISVNGAAVARAVGSLSDETLPDDLVQMLCHVALDDPDPEVDNWHGRATQMAPIDQAINSARGEAAGALALLLSADSSRWETLRPTIERLVEDRVLAVRSVAVNCLLAILDAHRTDALSFFERLAVGANPILGTHYVERFVHYAMFRDYRAIRPTLIRMLGSSHPATVRAGARHVALAALWIDEARGDERIALEMGEEARAGTAGVYADSLSNETVGAECEEHLRTLFTDESEAVRQEASRCWLMLEPDQIASRGSFIEAFAESMGSGGRVNILLYRLKDARLPLPAEVCDLAERAVAAYGFKASSIQSKEAGVAYTLAPLMVRMYEETSDPILRERVLDVIDDMIRAGFFGIDEKLGLQYDR